MKIKNPNTTFACIAGLLALLALIFVGCALLQSPTASSSTEGQSALWTPQPGEQVIPGHEVPILNANYWTDQFGPSVNPFNLPARQVRISSEGGVIILGPHRLIVPAGAVTEDITFRLSSASRNAVAVECEPSGLTFDTPVTMILSYVGTQYQNSELAASLRIYYMLEDGSLQEMPSVVNMSNNTVSAQLTHFSRYILG